jgi:two-component system LytT family response regulator
MMRVIIIDDEPLAIRELVAMLAKFPDVDVVDTARDVHEAKVKIEQSKPDLIFLDINMPGQSGFDLLEALDDVPYVVFVTAYDQYAMQAFEVNALDYILKPINKDRLQEAIQKVARVKAAQEQRKRSPIAASTDPNVLTPHRKLFLKDGEKCYFVEVSEIFLVESVGNYVRIHFGNHRPLIHRSLSYVDERLAAADFFRADRQHIINLRYIESIRPQINNTLEVTLRSGHQIELSQRQSVRFKELMGL